jgi:excisionase family DNA binding protein
MGEESAAVVVPVELAGLVDRLVGCGLRTVADRYGALPTVPDLDELRARLRTAAVSAGGRRPHMLEPQYRTYPCLTVGQAAEVMGVTARHARRLAKSGAIIARLVGRDWQIDAGSANQYSERRKSWQQAA